MFAERAHQKPRVRVIVDDQHMRHRYRCGSARYAAYLIDEALRIDRLHDVSVEPALRDPVALVSHRKRRHGDERYGLGARIALEPASQFVSVESRHQHVAEHEIEAPGRRSGETARPSPQPCASKPKAAADRARDRGSRRCRRSTKTRAPTLSRSERQRQRKRAALAESALHGKLAAEQCGEILTEIEPEARPFESARVGTIDLLEREKEPLRDFPGESRCPCRSPQIDDRRRAAQFVAGPHRSARRPASVYLIALFARFKST